MAFVFRPPSGCRKKRNAKPSIRLFSFPFSFAALLLVLEHWTDCHKLPIEFRDSDGCFLFCFTPFQFILYDALPPCVLNSGPDKRMDVMEGKTKIMWHPEPVGSRGGEATNAGIEAGDDLRANRRTERERCVNMRNPCSGSRRSTTTCSGIPLIPLLH